MAQGLFANQRETNLQSTIAVVEEVLGELGSSNPMTEGGTLRAWQIAKGSAMARVALIARPEFTHIRIEANVMRIGPGADRAALFGHLLALNKDLCGAAFALDGDRVLLVTERSTLDLDRSEVRELIHTVTTYADDHDDALVARFGGKLGG
jgi:hypothetical protein